MNAAMKISHFLVACAAGLVACSSDPESPKPADSQNGTPTTVPSEPSTPDENTDAPQEEEPFELFGAALGESPDVDFAAVIADPKAFAKQKIITSGVVRQACQARGCWMDVRPEKDRSGASITVRFKNYKFFVPLNSRGARVRMEGVTKVSTLSATEVAHLEEEGATFDNKNADGSVDTVEFTATGVEMRGRKQ